MKFKDKLNRKAQRLSRKMLQVIFGFDIWHISPLITRPYARDIIRFLNNAEKKESLVEIGCGLGDIIRNVKFRKKQGLDAEQNVLNAARFLSFFSSPVRKCRFERFVFPDDSIQGTHDAVLLVNWIHHITPETLRKSIDLFYREKLQAGGVLIIDTVADPAYKHNHDINFLTADLNSELICIGSYERGRKVWAIKKIK